MSAGVPPPCALPEPFALLAEAEAVVRELEVSTPRVLVAAASAHRLLTWGVDALRARGLAARCGFVGCSDTLPSCRELCRRLQLARHVSDQDFALVRFFIAPALSGFCSMGCWLVSSSPHPLQASDFSLI